MGNVAVIVSIDRKTGGEFYPVQFQSESAEYDSDRSKTNQGYLYKHTLTFRMVGLSKDNIADLMKLSKCEAVRLRDFNSNEITLGNPHVDLRVTWDDMIEGKAGSFVGTKVKVEFTTSQCIGIQSFK